MNFDDFSVSNLTKNQPDVKQKYKFKKVHIGPMGTFIEVIDFDNISIEHWKNGFVYKNIFYKYIKEESLIRTFEGYVHANNHKLYELHENQIVLKCFFTFVKVFGKVIIATPLVNM